MPIAFGLASVALIAWAVRPTRWTCDVFDEARLNWRCEGADFLLRLINAPPIIVIQPLANLWRTAPSYLEYLLVFPFILFWWWFVGTRLDFGVLGVGRYRRRRAWLSFLVASFVIFLAVFVGSLWDDIRFFRSHPYLDVNPYLASATHLRLLPLRLWLIVLMFAFCIAALRLLRGRIGHSGQKLVSARTLRLVTLCLMLYIIATAATVWHSKIVERRRQSEYDLHRIIIKGQVVDDRGLPVYAIKVDLIPVLSTGAIPVDEAASDFTNEGGTYELSPDQAGRYTVSVQWNAPPSTKHPFLTRYYNGAAQPEQAEILDITPERHMTLNPIRLQRLGLAKVPVSVSWSNGKREPDAYIFFRNSQYPHFGSIGNEALHADDDGTISLPIGFDYVANAQVDCDAGAKIDQSYTPELTFSLKTASTSVEPLHFVLPGSPCKVWHPQ